MIRPRKKARPGRMKGASLQMLRNECWMRDKGCCKRCGQDTWQELPHTASNAFHMSHIRAKRMGGDSIENVETLCGDCHRKFHHFGPSMDKPCPSKSRSL